ncbi:ABC transporter substrate-binding protein [Bradyrhizobium sp. AZCC 1693]|uniref:ABC transporter substrate-binding protein n=1 Tax=Bradyrhizobium sp. AZCC 1693 TaxID=3117029 RepID=UPI002FEE6FA7
MKRREFIAGTAALLVSPRRSRAQATPRRIGFLGNFLDPPGREAWRNGLRERGWIEGKNLLVEYRLAETPDRMPNLAAELVGLTPDLIVAAGPQAAVPLKSATATIPIVFVAVFDPVGLGLVQSLAHPGGNITGLATYVPGGWVAKRIEILRELVPGASKIAILVNPGNPIHRLLLAEEIPSTARNLGVDLPIVEASTAEKLDIAFASAASQRADAIIVFGDPLTMIEAPELSRSQRSIICPRFISSDNSPMADWSSTAPIYSTCSAVQAATSTRFSKASSLPICQ